VKVEYGVFFRRLVLFSAQTTFPTFLRKEPPLSKSRCLRVKARTERTK